MNILHVVNISFVIPYFWVINFHILIKKAIKSILYAVVRLNWNLFPEYMVLNIKRLKS